MNKNYVFYYPENNEFFIVVEKDIMSDFYGLIKNKESWSGALSNGAIELLLKSKFYINLGEL